MNRRLDCITGFFEAHVAEKGKRFSNPQNYRTIITVARRKFWLRLSEGTLKKLEVGKKDMKYNLIFSI